MSDVVIRVENLSKEYRLGTISHGTLYRDLQSVWAKFRGKEDPNSTIGSVNREQLNSTNDRFCALKDITFDVFQGEVVGIIGRNGAGKSTLLKIISRVTAPTNGTIKIKGRVASLLEVGTGFHPELTGRENIFLNGAILGMRKGEIEQKFDEIVRFAEIDKFIDTPVKRYSSGMYVRLAFAVAAHLDPEILLVDEVLAVGDVNFRQRCLKRMKSVSNEGRTVIFVSHDMASIRHLCSRGLWIDKGLIKLDGSSGEVTQFYEAENFNIVATSNGHFDRFPLPEKEFYIKWVELKDKYGKLSTIFNYGDSLEIILAFHGEAPQGSFTVEWLLFNETGAQISFGTANPLCNLFFDKFVRKVSCKLTSLPLTTGNYRFYFSARVWGQSRWDEWDSIVGFRILHADPYNTGFDVPNGPGGDFVLDQQWGEIKNELS